MKLDPPLIELPLAQVDVPDDLGLTWAWTGRQDYNPQINATTYCFPIFWGPGGGEVTGFNRDSRAAAFAMDEVGRLMAHFGGTHRKVLFVRLPAGQAVPAHTDGRVTKRYHRCHLPIRTHPDVVFELGKPAAGYHLRQGQWYEIDNVHRHAVHNRSPIDRIHLIVDIADG